LVATLRISIREETQSGAYAGFSRMGRAGIEPATLGLKVRLDTL
jgi:hypothetical protein